jgi:hypothetical protein
MFQYHLGYGAPDHKKKMREELKATLATPPLKSAKLVANVLDLTTEDIMRPVFHHVGNRAGSQVSNGDDVQRGFFIIERPKGQILQLLVIKINFY